jgi:putative transposase
MKKSKFTESEIFNILKQAEAGISVVDICREHGIGNSTFYKWRAKYGGMDASMMKRLKELEDENARLKRMFANSQMDNEILRETLKKL